MAEAVFLEEEAPKLEQWLKKGYHGDMAYMNNHFDKRLDPRKLVDGAKSVISLAYNYYPKENQNATSYKVAKYAYGQDYHHVIKDKLKVILSSIQDYYPDVNGRVFTDSAPVMGKSMGRESRFGLEWEEYLIDSKEQGVFLFLAEISTRYRVGIRYAI